MEQYAAPEVTELGSFAELTLSSPVTVTKTTGVSDVIIIGGSAQSVPGGQVLSIS